MLCIIPRKINDSDPIESLTPLKVTGLSEKELNKIFERLYRSDKSRIRKSGGSGLGLSICKSLVEGHNGDITASSSTLGGVKVTISLPIDT